jgi:excisionase family DNA binding protein
MRQHVATRLAYSIPQVLEEVPIGRSLIYEAIKSGDLKSLKIGRRRIILPDDLKAWLQRHRVGTGTDAR